MPDPCVAGVEAVFRREYARAVAVLVRHFGDIELAEEAVQDAFAVAVARWPSAGTPPSPPGGSSPRRATGPWTGCGARPPAIPGTPRRRWCTPATHPSRRGPCTTTG